MQTMVEPKTMASTPVRLTTPATRGARLMAAIIDSAIGVLFYMVSYIANTPEIFLAGIVAFWVYQIYLLSVYGQTVGKQISKIRIVRVNDEANGGFVTNVLMRLILNGLICLIPVYALVDVLFIFRQDQRCIHDMIAGTKVISA
jgi:uncharacterized RDD family membrane protein YckC